MRSRPLRFVALVLGGWIGARAWFVVPVLLTERADPIVAARTVSPRQVKRFMTRVLIGSMAPAPLKPAIWFKLGPVRVAPGQVQTRRATGPDGSSPVAPARTSPEPRPPAAPEAAIIPATLTPIASHGSPKRWSASAWLLARGDGTAGATAANGLNGGQLGGGQAGVRVAYLLDAKHRIALVGRIASPLHGAGAEAAAGIEWQPTRLPVRLVAEERVLLDTGHAAPGAGVIGGFGPLPVGLGVRAEGYGQAGVIARDGGVAYADGLLRVVRPVLARHGAAVTLGAGAWGGAQPGVARLDLGPSLGVSVPVEHRTLRLALDWRERVAGHARPGSGLTLVAGMDF